MTNQGSGFRVPGSWSGTGHNQEPGTSPSTELGALSLSKGNQEPVFLSQSSADTEAFGERLGQLLSGGEVIGLSGPLGAGKTVFVRGLARALGVAGREVASPTYVLERVYAGEKLALRHLDAYRLSGSDEFEASDLGASLGAPGSVAVVEWADRVAGALPAERLEISFENRGGDERRLTLTARGERHEGLLAGF